MPKHTGPKHIRVSFIDSGRTAQYPPDPAYPMGTIADLTRGKTPTCRVDLPYPAPRCGQWVVGCTRCHQVNVITAAGRVDDPRRVILACKTPTEAA